MSEDDDGQLTGQKKRPNTGSNNNQLRQNLQKKQVGGNQNPGSAAILSKEALPSEQASFSRNLQSENQIGNAVKVGRNNTIDQKHAGQNQKIMVVLDKQNRAGSQKKNEGPQQMFNQKVNAPGVP